MKRFVLAAVAASLLASAALAGSVAAADEPDGAYARWSFDGGGGLAILSYTGATTVNAGVLGLLSSQEYFLIGRSINCRRTPSDSNELFRLSAMADGNGSMFVDGSDFLVWQGLRSLWLEPSDGSAAARCAVTRNFQNLDVAAGDVNGDGALGIWDKEHVLSLVERRAHNRARLTLTIPAGSGNDELTFVGVNQPCDVQATMRLFRVHVGSVDVGAFESRAITMSESRLEQLRSVRVMDGGAPVGCYPMSIIAVLIG